jgi:hypothetical protein
LGFPGVARLPARSRHEEMARCLPPKYDPCVRLPPSLLAEFKRQGRRGGLARARRLTPGARKAIARRAGIRRWTRARFGAARFEDLRLPGGVAIDKGLDDLAGGIESLESLVVSLAASRLRREGVPVPEECLQDADRRLYRLLESRNDALAHARYLAWLRQVASFADACRLARRVRSRHAR